MPLNVEIDGTWRISTVTVQNTTATGNWRRTTMHPMFIKLFMETDADDLAADEQDQRRARRAKRGKPARVMKTAARDQNRLRQP